MCASGNGSDRAVCLLHWLHEKVAAGRIRMAVKQSGPSGEAVQVSEKLPSLQVRMRDCK